ncbi:MAG: MBL fold metallo-hydrolase [Cytophagales bacterium]|nr:MBL fold metallo-hydrolase [Cytophagales bacterium]
MESNRDFTIRQFEDKNLAHYSYAILSRGEVALIDPARDPRPYYEFAKANQAKITAVIETHPHADFVSSHLEVHNDTGATIYVSKLLGAEYPHKPFDEGQTFALGEITLQALNTPGHSPDSISVVARDKHDKPHAVFTGDTLFIGDCGRPDLRESAGALTAAREDLARQMYHSLQTKMMPLPDDVIVYPAHGAGSLCGKGLSQQNTSTMGAEKLGNWSLQKTTEKEFVRELLADQPFVPKYFPFAVAVNKRGAEGFVKSISRVISDAEGQPLDPALPLIDARPQEAFKKGHHPGAINLMHDTKFETWLGSIINPGERFQLVAGSEPVLQELIGRIARIGYEGQITAALVDHSGKETTAVFDADLLRKKVEAYTVVDIRNPSEVKALPLFKDAVHIPLYELRERLGEIPTSKPVVVHCAGGYRSAAGSSMLQAKAGKGLEVYDLSESVKTFIP